MTVVSTNIRISSFLVTYFVYKRLNIILTGNAYSFGSPGKSGLRFLDCYGRSVTYNDFPFPIAYGEGIIELRRLFIQFLFRFVNLPQTLGKIGIAFCHLVIMDGLCDRLLTSD